VYTGGAVIQGADPVTFEPAGMEGLGRDKTDYYLLTEPLHVRDMASFKILDANVCGKDHHIWAQDKLDYYVGKQASPISDSATFQVLQSWYAKDAKQVYFGGNIIIGADPTTFVVDPSEPEKASDKNRHYQSGEPVP
jgi:hypothetical protein